MVVVLAIDIETSGSLLGHNGILSIGASLQNLDRKEIESFFVNMQLVDGRSFEESCRRDFWDKNPIILEFVSQQAVHPTQGMKAFGAFIDNAQRTYPNLIVVSDNPSFDIAWIDYYLSVYGDRKPLRYNAIDGKYDMIWDAASVQKTWCSMKIPGADFLSPLKGHKEALGLEHTVPKDHNPLNDARNIAGFYIQTLSQMTAFKESLPKPQAQRTIQLEEYNPVWKEYFQIEKAKIEGAFAGTHSLLDVLHIGSTSVEGLTAKPIIDMSVVVQDPYAVDSQMANAGYKYKGEYNIPTRRMYGKKGDYEVYTHVYKAGNPEIALHCLFRDYLTTHQEAREEYATLKKLIITQDSAHKIASSGITTYNLQKNDFIQKIITAIGFSELCMRLCAQDSEWQAYDGIRSAYFHKVKRDSKLDTQDPNKKHIVFIKGTEVVAAAQINLSIPNVFLEFVASKNAGAEQGLLVNLLSRIEDWIGKLGALFVSTLSSTDEAEMFGSCGYMTYNAQDESMHMMKYLGEAEVLPSAHS